MSSPTIIHSTHSTLPYTDTIWHGASWYPEIWPDKIDEDLSKMREIGLNCLRLGDSVWGVLEASDGKFSLDWYGSVLDRIHAAGLKFVLTTPTYTPPRWLTRDYPEAVRVDKDGLPFLHGSRGHGSYFSKDYTRLSERIATKMAQRFGNHPGLLAWQIDNEVGCHADGDFSPAAAAAWHAWLEKRFGDIATLNERWGTRVWDQYYDHFSDVQLPGKTPYGNTIGTATGDHNTSLLISWGEFISDTNAGFIHLQAAAIRKHSAAPITHNHIQLERTYPADLFAPLDIVSTDSYWWPGTAQNHHRSIAWMRGLKRRADGSPVPFWLLETTPFQLGGTSPHVLKDPGFQVAEAALFLGSGSTAHLYWLWRQQRTGIESSHGALLTCWGEPTPGWGEVKSVSEFIEKAHPLLADLFPTTPDVAVHDPKLSKQLFQRGNSMYSGTDAQATYRREVDDSLLQGGWHHDLLPESGDPSLYRVVLSPWMPIIPEPLVQRMLEWVKQGGTWVVGPASALRDECGGVFTDHGMGPLEIALGFRTRFWQGVDGITGTLGDQEIPLSGLGYMLDAGECTALGHYTSSYADGHAWAVERTLGAGRVVVFAAWSKGNYGILLEHALAGIPLRRQCTSGPAVYIMPRHSADGRSGYIATNAENSDGWIEVSEAGTDLLTGRMIPAGRVELAPFGVLAVIHSSAF